jgi:hypothetical protein
MANLKSIPDTHNPPSATIHNLAFNNAIGSLQEHNKILIIRISLVSVYPVPGYVRRNPNQPHCFRLNALAHHNPVTGAATQGHGHKGKHNGRKAAPIKHLSSLFHAAKVKQKTPPKAGLFQKYPAG